MNCIIKFPPKWIDASALEETLTICGEPHSANADEVIFWFPKNSKIMVDAAVRLLSLVNQLDFSMHRVRLKFEEGELGTMGYLNRMGFFDHLSSNIQVTPQKPVSSGAKIYGGTNADLVEIATINPQSRDQDLPTRLTTALMRPYTDRADARQLEGAAWTIFAELIDNIFSHSGTPIDGYAALQLYPRSNKLKVAVSDSGLGIMETLRPALKVELPAMDRLSDVDLLVEIFRQGISRHGSDRGCGLKGSAAKAIKYNADLDVRLPNTRVVLTPSRGSYQANTAYCYEYLPLIWGTHICFTFHLDF